MFETIIVPLDGSALAEAALPLAVEFVGKFGSRVVLVRSVEPSSTLAMQPPSILESPSATMANMELLTQMVQSEHEDAKTYLEAVRQKLGGAAVETVVAEGNAAAAIVELAQQRAAGLIIMSSHGRGGLGRLVFGSVADSVLRDSQVPVLLLRSRDEKDA